MMRELRTSLEYDHRVGYVLYDLVIEKVIKSKDAIYIPSGSNLPKYHFYRLSYKGCVQDGFCVVVNDDDPINNYKIPPTYIGRFQY